MKHLHDKLYVMAQIAIDDFAKFAKAGVKVIINNRPDDEEAGQLNHQQAIAQAQAVGIAYHYLPMVNGQPLPSDLVSSFKTIIDSSEDMVLAHCRSGMRSTVIWAIGQIEDQKMSVNEAISAANSADIPLEKVRSMLENL
jgi:uncharacterized protein (TIGR01244 family)